MSIPVTLPSGSTTTNAYGSARPIVGDYVRLTVGGVTNVYTVRWVLWETDAFTGASKATIGAALPSDPGPNPPS